MHVFISVKSNTLYFESSRLVAVAHGKVWLGVVEHFLELSIGLKLSLVVVGIVAHLSKSHMSEHYSKLVAVIFYPVGGNG